MKTLEEKFWMRVEKTDTCWNWIKSKSRGYGMMSIRYGLTRLAHRVSLEVHGIPIPKGMVVDHMCRNRACVRPDHLRIVTPTVNRLENNESPIAKNARKTECKNGHPFSGRNLMLTTLKNGNPARICRTCVYTRTAYYKKHPLKEIPIVYPKEVFQPIHKV